MRLSLLGGGNADPHLFLSRLGPSLISLEWGASPPEELLSLYLWMLCERLPTAQPSPPCLGPHGSAVAPMVVLLSLDPDPLTLVLGPDPRQKSSQVHMPHCLGIRKPGIMLFCILFFSLNVLVERFLIKLNIIFRVVDCMMACVLWTFEVYDVERPWDVTDLLFFRDSEDFFLAAYLCLRLGF